MGRVEFFLDWGCDPIWIWSDEGTVIANDRPPEVEADPQLMADLDWIRDTYDSLFINTPHEFSWKGFDSPKARQEFDDKVEATAQRLNTVLDGKYVFVDKASRDS